MPIIIIITTMSLLSCDQLLFLTSMSSIRMALIDRMMFATSASFHAGRLSFSMRSLIVKSCSDIYIGFGFMMQRFFKNLKTQTRLSADHGRALYKATNIFVERKRSAMDAFAASRSSKTIENYVASKTLRNADNNDNSRGKKQTEDDPMLSKDWVSSVKVP